MANNRGRGFRRGGGRFGYRRNPSFGQSSQGGHHGLVVTTQASQDELSQRSRSKSAAIAQGSKDCVVDEGGYVELLSQYWPGQTVASDDKRRALIESLRDVLSTEASSTNTLRINDMLDGCTRMLSSVSIPVDWEQICLCVPELEEAMLHAPSEALTCLEIAIHDAMRQKGLERMDMLDSVRVRLYNYSKPLQQQGSIFESIGSIKADRVGKLVTIRGTVTKISPIKSTYTRMEFTCMRCHQGMMVKFVDGIFQPPPMCTTGFCQSRYLKANPRHSCCEDWQKVHIQPLQADQKKNELESSSNLVQVELTHDLVDSCSHGDVVIVTGIVKVLPSQSQTGRGGIDSKKARLFLPYVQAVSIRKADDISMSNPDERSKISVIPRGLSFLPAGSAGFTEKDLCFIQKYAIRCQGRSLKVIVQSIAPGIFGMEMIKAGLALSLFGGMHGLQEDNSENLANKNFRIRGDIHCLLVGDPGLGKSRLLQAVANLAPRGVYVCGPSASTAGLTLSISKSDGEFSLESGALVTADRGVCCVDEFDKLASEHASLLGVMEQQEVSLAKAGLVASLPARTTIIAAANPIGGHYNKSLSLKQNLKMSPALLSRFDLVFLLLDKPNEEADKKLAGQIASNSLSLDLSINQATKIKARQSFDSPEEPNKCLKQMLQEKARDDEILPPQLIKKLVAYARQYVHPKLSSESKNIIKDFYLNVRQRAAGDMSTPVVTHRFLESLIRLSEARARIELRDIVTARDALDAIEIVEQTINGSFCGGPDTIIFDHPKQKKIGRTGARFQQERERFLSAVRQYCQKRGSKDIMIHELFTLADNIELAVEDTVGFLDYLNELGYFLKRPKNLFQYLGRI